MKTAEEILNKKGVTIEAMHYNSDNAYKAVCNIIEQAQKEAYNQALEDAINPHEVDMYYDENVGFCIVKQSILKLKK